MSHRKAVREGNQIEFLRNGNESSCHAPSYKERGKDRRLRDVSVLKGKIGEEFAETLAERAAAGVQVSCLFDGVSAAKMDLSLIDDMDQAGARVAWFHSPCWYTLHKLNNRMHCRILVVDGCVGFTGGVGIADEWNGDCEDPKHWRETHVRVEGSAVRDLLGAFWEHWSEATEQMLTGSHFPDIPSFDGARCTSPAVRSRRQAPSWKLFTRLSRAPEGVYGLRPATSSHARLSSTSFAAVAAASRCASSSTAPIATKK
jgi:cardiolipin synthase A/B